MHRFNFYIVWEVSKLFVVALVAFTSKWRHLQRRAAIAQPGLGPDGGAAIDSLHPADLFAICDTCNAAICGVQRLWADQCRQRDFGGDGCRSATDSLYRTYVNCQFTAEPIRRLAQRHCSILGYAGNQSDCHAIGRASGLQLLGLAGLVCVRAGLFDTRAWHWPRWTRADSSDHQYAAPERRQLGRDYRLFSQIDRRPYSGGVRIDLVDMEIQHGTWVSMQPGENTYRVKLSQATKKGTSSGRPVKFPMHDWAGNQEAAGH